MNMDGNVSHHHSTLKKAIPVTGKKKKERKMVCAICLQSLLPGSVIYSLADPRIDAEHHWISVSLCLTPVGWEGIFTFTSKYKIQVSPTTTPRFKWFNSPLSHPAG